MLKLTVESLENIDFRYVYMTIMYYKTEMFEHCSFVKFHKTDDIHCHNNTFSWRSAKMTTIFYPF